MQNSVIVNQFYQALDELLIAAELEASSLRKHRSTLSIDYCPSRSEIIPILRGCAVIAQAFGAFLTVLKQVLDDKSLVQAAIRDLSNRLPDVVPLINYLLTPYHVVNSLNSERIKTSFSASQLWIETTKLVSWYAYLGSSGTASTSLISKVILFFSILGFCMPCKSICFMCCVVCCGKCDITTSAIK